MPVPVRLRIKFHMTDVQVSLIKESLRELFTVVNAILLHAIQFQDYFRDELSYISEKAIESVTANHIVFLSLLLLLRKAQGQNKNKKKIVVCFFIVFSI